ncbi:FAD-dependent oxidoreductase [Pedobacter yonginense]|uniref:FAD-dependent oxidoreductase n=1 Tax=Pedobacter yonginense TaxID=651869 RepID=A0A317EJC0_9SPHI|nr:NAD(P)/FAD-dependent oxidoreductase [Pedobacter yonginense]PWS26951.1 FAD-dependent oxidoreductase [Pedobacter yonginense]
MHFETDILIIGGGLAGLTAALHLKKAGLNVILVEKNQYPHHKVCGEYISNEVIPYLNWLGVDIDELKPSKIQHLNLTTRSGKTIKAKLPLGGFGISRYTLDHFLYRLLQQKEVCIMQDQVTNIEFADDIFSIQTSKGDWYKAKHVLGAHGKRSNLDQKLNRDFMNQKSPFLAVKAHYAGNFPNDLVGLYNFKGGYCGVSNVEDGKINICYLADYETFKRHKNIEEYQQQVLYKNKQLKEILEQSNIIFDQPITISQLYFGEKSAVDQHILMIGDTAGLIHPLCGNGMAMAIHSAKKASELLIDFYQGRLNSRASLEANYTSVWNAEFKSRLKMGSLLSYILQKEKLTNILMNALSLMPFLLTKIITKTHGKPITIPSK